MFSKRDGPEARRGGSLDIHRVYPFRRSASHTPDTGRSCIVRPQSRRRGGTLAGTLFSTAFALSWPPFLVGNGREPGQFQRRRVLGTLPEHAVREERRRGKQTLHDRDAATRVLDASAGSRLFHSFLTKEFTIRSGRNCPERPRLIPSRRMIS